MHKLTHAILLLFHIKNQNQSNGQELMEIKKNKKNDVHFVQNSGHINKPL